MNSIIRILRFTSALKKNYIWIAVLTIVIAAVSQLQPLITKFAIDEITKSIGGSQIDMRLIILLAVGFFLADLVQTLLSNVIGYIGDITSVKIQRIMSERYFSHLLQLSQSYFDSEVSGKIINRMSRGITQIASYMQVLTNNFLQFIFGTVFTLGIVFYFSWQVGLMLLLVYPVFIYLTTRSSPKWQTYQTKINEEQDIASGRFAESINQVKVVKSFLREKSELDIFSRHIDTMVKTTYPQSSHWHRRDVLRRVILNVIFFGIFGYIFIETANGAYTIGTMVLLIQMAIQIRIPIFSISYIVDQTQRAVANSKDFFSVMDLQPEINDNSKSTDLIPKDASITFKDVVFGYGENKVLKGVSFKIEPKSKHALVGESGEGKTTITNLLLRLYELDSGTIQIDGQDISMVTQQSIRRDIAVVFQEPHLFSGTIRENIAYGNADATDEDIIKAAKAANAHDFIRKLNNEYDSEIGERGLKLSGGQKQRIAIARAILKDAPILILDEATSSLDSKSEAAVQDALGKLMKDRTTLIIAHRLSTIQSADTIVTLKNGMIDEIGSPSQLAGSGGIYDQLLKLQDVTNDSNRKKLLKYEISE
ncbi:ABC transporter ATP-binding protein [Candidatus Saccharibacteria bacterium]|nr:ABC transporter ATP-binding protein [Candidatus Saccharibacteria bacterium]